MLLRVYVFSLYIYLCECVNVCVMYICDCTLVLVVKKKTHIVANIRVRHSPTTLQIIRFKLMVFTRELSSEYTN